METRAHRHVAVAVAVGAAHLHSIPLAGVAVSALCAAITAGGWTSPDVDNQPLAKEFDSLVPDEVLGNGGPLGHRRLAHSWLLPAAAWWAWGRNAVGVPTWALCVPEGALYGWVSHLVMDLVFGERGYGHPKGVPLFLWWGHVGFGRPNEGPLALWTSRAAVILSLWWAIGLVLPGLPLEPYVPSWWRSLTAP